MCCINFPDWTEQKTTDTLLKNIKGNNRIFNGKSSWEERFELIKWFATS